MRTLQLGMAWPTEEAGGLTRYYADLVRELPKVGVAVRGLVLGSADVERASCGVVRAFAPGDASLARRLRTVRRCVRGELERGDCDLLVSHFALYAAPCVDLLGDRPLVAHFHGPWALEARSGGGPWLKFRAQLVLERWVYRRADAFIVLSRAFAMILEQWYGVPPERIHVLPGGVDVDRFAVPMGRGHARERLGWPRERPVVLTVRRLVRRMGIERLVEAAALVRRVVPDVLFQVVGTGPLASELRRQVEESGLGDLVGLLGYVGEAELPLAYRAADLSVVPSIELEGFGLVVLESLAAGTPVLVTPVGGLPEVAAPLSASLVLPGSSAAELAEGITAALTGSLPLPSSDDCRGYARDRFAWPVVASAVGDVYRAVER